MQFIDTPTKALSMSSNEITQSHSFGARVRQRKLIDMAVPKDFLALRLTFYRQFGARSCTGDALGPITFGVPNVLTERKIMIPISDVKLELKRYEWTKVIADRISSMGVPEVHQQGVIEVIFQVAEVAIPELPILVNLLYLTVHRVDNSIDMVRMESLVANTSNLIPATKSSIKCLEKVRLDSLESEATIRQAPCAICCESLDYFDAGEDDVDHQQMITHLPCQHHYHADCIVRWLEISHLCPVCRYPLPFLEMGKQSNIFMEAILPRSTGTVPPVI